MYQGVLIANCVHAKAGYASLATQDEGSGAVHVVTCAVLGEEVHGRLDTFGSISFDSSED